MCVSGTQFLSRMCVKSEARGLAEVLNPQLMQVWYGKNCIGLGEMPNKRLRCQYVFHLELCF